MLPLAKIALDNPRRFGLHISSTVARECLNGYSGPNGEWEYRYKYYDKLRDVVCALAGTALRTRRGASLKRLIEDSFFISPTGHPGKLGHRSCNPRVLSETIGADTLYDVLWTAPFPTLADVEVFRTGLELLRPEVFSKLQISASTREYRLSALEETVRQKYAPPLSLFRYT